MIQWGTGTCSIKSGNYGQKAVTITLALAYRNTIYTPIGVPMSSWFAHGCNNLTESTFNFIFKHLGQDSYTLTRYYYFTIGIYS